ncbi:MAG: hypothetical protein AB7Q17_02250 [Phycisphaerae bacterium]
MAATSHSSIAARLNRARWLSPPGALWIAALALLVTQMVPTARAQFDADDRPLLPETISDSDIEMRGRYVRQWKKDDGVLVLIYNGGFQLDMGRRKLRANEAVIWITPGQADSPVRKFYELTVYLAGDAEIEEPAGTVTQDNVLLISNLRTFGRIVKFHDAHAPDAREDTPLYQQAIRDRALIEGTRGATTPAAPATPGVAPVPGGVEVTRPGDALAARTPKPPRAIRYRFGRVEPSRTPDDEPVFIASEGVYLSQSGSAESGVLEIRAQTAVVFPTAQAAEGFLGAFDESGSPAPTTGPATPSGAAAGGAGPGAASPSAPAAPPPDESASSAIEQRVRAVYLEGDVILSHGNRFIRANRLYYDFERDRALILDAVFRADLPDRGVPLYVRAGEVRQLSAQEYSASNARVTTSEFYSPHYHVGAEKVVIRDRTARDASGSASGPVAGTYELRNAALNVEGLPLLWWPYSRGSFEESETALKSLRLSYSGDRGGEIETEWNLFSLMGVEKPPGFDATLRLDGYTKRGGGVGIDADYAREDNYGLLRTYYLHDNGEDRLGPLRSGELDSASRGRVLWRHRHYLPQGWEATLELSYISDPNFLEEWRKDEFNEGKEQETLIYLKKAKDLDALTLLANWRLLDFVTQTEHLPDVAYRRIGDTLLDPVVSYTEARLGGVRYRPDDRRFFDRRRFDNTGETDYTFRTDGRQEFELPIKLDWLNIVPFASVRGSFWDGQPRDDGGLWRGLGVYGVRGAAIFSRVFPGAVSELLDISRIRHIVQPHFALWGAGSNTRSELITPFDYGIETIDPFYGGLFGVRQVWQTKRGIGDKQRTVDWVTLNLEVGAFGNTDGRNDVSNGYVNPFRPENSRARNYFAGDAIWRISDTTSLLYDFNFDLNDRSFDRHNISLAVERLPRTAYVFGVRYAGDIDMNLAGGGFNYRMTEKHIAAARLWWDIETGQFGEGSIALIRRLPRWYLAVDFEYSNVDDDFTVSLSLWPEGVPEWKIGSGRYTGLSTSTGIRPK